MTAADSIIADRGDGLTREQLIPLLQEIQAADGFVSTEAMVAVANALETPVSRVYGVATFYNQFRFAPLGEHVIEVCRGTACHVKQSLALAQHLKRRLKLRDDGNSADGRFTVVTVACLGACSHRAGDQAGRRVLRPPDRGEAGRPAGRSRSRGRRSGGLNGRCRRRRDLDPSHGPERSETSMNHSQLMTPCCTRCRHTPSAPCADVIECIDHGPVCHDDDACREERAARLARARAGRRRHGAVRRRRHLRARQRRPRP